MAETSLPGNCESNPGVPEDACRSISAQNLLTLVGRQLREPNSYNLWNPELRLCVDKIGEEVPAANIGQFLERRSEVADPRP